MFVLTCERDTVIDVGSTITVRVVSIDKDTVKLEIVAPGDIWLEPDAILDRTCLPAPLSR
jgi:sRNA-binding carbon storage regulator CsrA